MVTSTTQVVVNFVNPRKPASVTIKKVDDAGNTLAGAVFTLFTDNAPFGPGTPRQANDTITGFSCTTPASGICTISNILPAGKYWVVETTTPPGHQTAPDQHVELALGQNLNLTSSPFVNPRLHKVIVIVCHLGTNSLTAVPVASGGQTKTSTTTNPAGVNLCDTGGASFSGYSHSDDPSFQTDIGGGSHP